MTNDVVGADVNEAGSVVVGKDNRQQVSEHQYTGGMQVSVDARGDGHHEQQWGDRRDSLRMEQKLDQVLYRLDTIERRVQQVEIAMQLGGRSSQGERLSMFLVIAVALAALLLNVYTQVMP
jgi:hypothetical protein